MHARRLTVTGPHGCRDFYRCTQTTAVSPATVFATVHTCCDVRLPALVATRTPTLHACRVRRRLGPEQCHVISETADACTYMYINTYSALYRLHIMQYSSIYSFDSYILAHSIDFLQRLKNNCDNKL